MKLPYTLKYRGAMRRDKYYMSEIYHWLYKRNPKLAWRFETLILNRIYKSEVKS